MIERVCWELMRTRAGELGAPVARLGIDHSSNRRVTLLDSLYIEATPCKQYEKARRFKRGGLHAVTFPSVALNEYAVWLNDGDRSPIPRGVS
jgi:hypothetical protein